MKKRIAKSVLAITLCMTLALCPMSYNETVSAASTSVTVSGTQNAATARKVLKQVNKERSEQGLSSLKMSAVLEKAAQQRAMELAVSFSHDRPDGSTFFTAITGLGVTYKTVAENIGNGSSDLSVDSVMSLWMNSSVHKGNILGDFTYIGIACFKSENKTYYVQMFAKELSDTTLAAETGEDGIETTATIDASAMSTSSADSNKPAKVRIKKTSTYIGSKIKLKVTIKKVSKAKGYQIAVYGTKKNANSTKKVLKKKNFKGKTVSLSIKNKSKRSKIFVRVRAYTRSGGNKLYGEWSGIKKIRTEI